MWHNNELSAQYARERCREYIKTAERDRRAAMFAQPVGLARRAARPLGRGLLHAGAWLLRYSRAEMTPTTTAYRAPSSAGRWN